MNNDNRANDANDANDNGDELFVGLTETDRQEMLRRNLEFEREQRQLLQERDRLLWELLVWFGKSSLVWMGFLPKPFCPHS